MSRNLKKSIQNKIKTLLNKSKENNQLKNALIVGTISTMGIISPTQTQANNTLSDTLHNDTEIQKDNIISEYLNIVPISSIDEIRNGQRNAAEYNSLIDGIIYTQYSMINPTKQEALYLNSINESNRSESIKKHELLHRDFEHILQKVHEGDYILKQSQYVTTNMMAELLCFKQENPNKSMQEIIQKFAQENRNEYYSRHYSSYKNNSILLALSAEKTVSENINKAFTRTKDFKLVTINGTKYAADLFKTADKKYQTYFLHDIQTDNIVTDKNILAQSPIKCNLLLSADGKEVKNEKGKNVELNTYPNYETETYIAQMENIDKESVGYSFNRANQDYEKILDELLKIAGISQEEGELAKNYIRSQNNTAHDQLYMEDIKNIKDTYKDYSLAQIQERTKKNFQESQQQRKEKFIKENMPSLVPLNTSTNNKGNTNYQFYSFPQSNVR